MLLYRKRRLNYKSCKGSKEDSKKIKAIYVRVSTDMQVEGYSIDAQIELVKAYCKSKEWDDYKIYIDPGFSGKDLNRPKIQELIEDVKNGLIDCVLVYKLDRISRSQKDTLYLIEEVFNKYDCGFISIRESFDTTTPFGKAMIGILSVFAQLERETILERTRLGLKKRAEDGLWKGGGKAPFVYDYDKNVGMLVVNEERKKIFDTMKSLRLQGYSYPQLESLTGIDESMIQSILNCRTNLGLITYKGEEYPGQHEAVITQEEYDSLMEVEKNRSKSQGSKHYLLSGKLYCSHCGAKYRYQKWGQRIICYCYSQQKSKPKLIKDANCKNKRLDSFEIEDSFLESLFELGLNETKFNEAFNLTQIDTKKELESRIVKIDNKIENLVAFISEEKIPEAVSVAENQISELVNEKKTVKQKLDSIKKEQKFNATFEQIHNLRLIWNYMSFEEQRGIIEHLVDKIMIDNNTLKIKWKISTS